MKLNKNNYKYTTLLKKIYEIKVKTRTELQKN